MSTSDDSFRGWVISFDFLNEWMRLVPLRDGRIGAWDNLFFTSVRWHCIPISFDNFFWKII